MAERGDIQAAALVIKFGRGDHRAGVIGDYETCPEEALSATFKLKLALNGMLPIGEVGA